MISATYTFLYTCNIFIYQQQQPFYMEEKKESKREEIERLLKAGKTRKEILAFTGANRSYIWEVAEALKLAEARGEK